MVGCYLEAEEGDDILNDLRGQGEQGGGISGVVDWQGVTCLLFPFFSHLHLHTSFRFVSLHLVSRLQSSLRHHLSAIYLGSNPLP